MNGEKKGEDVELSDKEIVAVEETPEVVTDKKGEQNSARKPRYTFELEDRDLEDALKMSAIIKKNHSLSRSTPAYVAKYLFLEVLKEYRKAGLI